jgi:hypothetical protein
MTEPSPRYIDGYRPEVASLGAVRTSLFGEGGGTPLVPGRLTLFRCRHCDEAKQSRACKSPVIEIASSLRSSQ